MSKRNHVRYDIFNRRIVKSIDADGAGPNPAEQEIFIHDGLRSERGGAGDHILLRFDGGGDLADRYLHGPAVDQILAEETVANPAVAGDVLWALTDQLGTVRDLVQYDTVNDSSTIANHIVYDAFGRIIAESDPAPASLLGFTGRERDGESDLQYNRARYYDAALGRWLGEDPIGFNAGDANLYRYVGNGPTNDTDPSGEIKIKIRGYVFYVHPNDADPFPSGPHAHIGGPNSPRKVHIKTGQIFQGATPTDCSIPKKTLAELRERLRRAGLLGTAFVIISTVPEIANAAEDGGVEGVVELGVQTGVDVAIDAGTTAATGGVILGGAAAAGTTITVGGTAVTGVAGATGVGGAVIVAGGGGYAIGNTIGRCEIDGRSICDRLGDGIGAVIYWVFY